MKFGQLILRRIINSLVTTCQISRLKCTKIDFDWGSAPHPARGAYSAPSWNTGVLLLREGEGYREGYGNGRDGNGDKGIGWQRNEGRKV